jgi:hypothetical protein
VTDLRTSQNVSLALRDADPDLRVGQNITQVAYQADPDLRVAHNVAQALYAGTPIRVAQNVCLVLMSTSGCTTQLSLNSTYKFRVPEPPFGGRIFSHVLNCLYKFIPTSSNPATTSGPKTSRLIGHAGLGIYRNPSRRRPTRRG